jgi:hypothetical protein
MPDLLAMQKCNLLCLPENYQLKVRVHPLRQHSCLANSVCYRHLRSQSCYRVAIHH